MYDDDVSGLPEFVAECITPGCRWLGSYRDPSKRDAAAAQHRWQNVTLPGMESVQ